MSDQHPTPSDAEAMINYAHSFANAATDPAWILHFPESAVDTIQLSILAAVAYEIRKGALTRDRAIYWAGVFVKSAHLTASKRAAEGSRGMSHDEGCEAADAFLTRNDSSLKSLSAIEAETERHLIQCRIEAADYFGEALKRLLAKHSAR